MVDLQYQFYSMPTTKIKVTALITFTFKELELPETY